MNLKVYSGNNKKENKNEEKNVEKEQFYYDMPKLICNDGLYYIGYLDDKVEIAQWEALQVYEHPETVYDVIVSHRRKYYFNTAEDSPRNMFH